MSQNPIITLLQGLKTSEPQIVGNIAFMGLLDKNAPEERVVLSLNQALLLNQLKIRDTGGYEHLTFEPQAPTLLRASQGVLKGGKQDRIVQRSEVLTRNRELEVYCIEKNRWDESDRDWTPSDIPVPIRRAVLEGQPQDTIWGMINSYLHEWKVDTRTSALGAIYDALGSQFERFVANFEVWRNQVGMVVAINGVISGLEFFGDKQSFHEDGMQLLRDSYVPEALRLKGAPMLPENVATALDRFLEEVEAGKRRTEIVPYENRVVYASAI